MIIGAMTGPKSEKHKLDPKWVYSLLNVASIWNIPTFIKNNVNWSIKIQEFPKIVQLPEGATR